MVATVLGLVVPGVATAHLERPSYWPDPSPDTSVNPPAGGAVPTARTLESAVTGEGPGQVRVVCKGEQGAAPGDAGQVAEGPDSAQDAGHPEHSR